MEKLADILTNYFYDEDSLPAISCETFKYVVMSALEMASGILASVIIAIFLDMKMETVVFLAVFWILRSYAGGIHMDRFSHCFVFSSLVMTGTLLSVKYSHIPLLVSHLMVGGGVIAFLLTEPESDKNRRVDDIEDTYFRKKLRQFLFIIMAVYIGCVLGGIERYAFLIAVTVDVVYLLMVMGKVKNGKK